MRILSLCLCLVCFQPFLQAQDFCSLLVKVVRPSGAEEPALVPVTVEERDGRRVQRRYTGGGVNFCDLGILPVTVTVGRPGCNQVIVRNVPLIWGEMGTVLVTYDFGACSFDAPPRVNCGILFRFIDSQGSSIRGATLRMEAPYELTYEADQFGRIMVNDVGFGQEFRGVGILEGYAETSVQLTCTREK